MPITFRAIPEYNLAILVHVGKIPDDEFLAFYESLYKSDSFDPSMNLIVDLRKTDSSPRSTEALYRFAQSMRVTQGITTRTKVAVVAPKDLSFGLARMCQTFADSVPWDFVVFRAMDAALAWLDLPGDLINLRTEIPNKDL